MRIAFLNIDDKTGGAAIAAMRLAEAMNLSTNAKVEIIVQDKKTEKSFVKCIDSSFYAKFSNFIRFSLERLYFLPHEKSKEVRFAFSPAKIGINIASKVDWDSYDIIHIHWINFGYLSINDLKFIKSLGKPTVFTMHDMWLFTGGCHYNQVCRNFEDKCGNCNLYIKQAKEFDLSRQNWEGKKTLFSNWNKLKIVGCSSWMKREAMTSSILRDKEILAIPNTINMEVFKPLEKISAKKRLGLSADIPVVLFSAMNANDHRKGGDLLFESLKILFEKNQNFQVLIVGKSDETIANSLPVKVSFTGFIDSEAKMAEVYNASDVFSIPSRQDNLPNSVLEALSCGIPSVGFDIGGVSEMIIHKTNGFIAGMDDIAEFAEGLDWILTNENYPSLSKNAREFAVENYSNKAVSRKYLDIYEDLTSII